MKADLCSGRGAGSISQGEALRSLDQVVVMARTTIPSRLAGKNAGAAVVPVILEILGMIGGRGSDRRPGH